LLVTPTIQEAALDIEAVTNADQGLDAAIASGSGLDGAEFGL
jgi:hypothetical protein